MGFLIKTMEMEEKEFAEGELIESLGFGKKLEPYDFEKYRAKNPNLSKKMYAHCRMQGILYKVLLGYEVRRRELNRTVEVLNPVWFLGY